MGSEDGTGSRKNPRVGVEASRSKDDALPLQISLVDSDHDSRRRSNDTENTVNEGPPSPAKRPHSSCSVSSCSSESSSECFFQTDPQTLPKSCRSPPASPRAHGGDPSLLKDDKNDTSSDNSSKSEEPDNWSPAATSSPVSDITHESLMQSMSPTQFPPIQVMERPGDFDPNRIPSSVFASKSSTPVEWSVASTESLFSIHIGNNSFSRDHAFMFKSGELTKSGELNKSAELGRFTRQTPAVVGGEGEIKSLDVGKGAGVRKKFGASDELMKVVPEDTVYDSGEVKLPPLGGSWNSPHVNHRSDGSGASSQSFAFPIKKKCCAYPLCHCSNCSWAFCYCTWPSCSCKWPSCRCKPSGPSCCCKWPSWPGCSFRWPKWLSCRCKWPSCPSWCCKWPTWLSCKCHCSSCSWAFCYCWNCKRKSSCSSSYDETLTDGGRTASGMGSPEKQCSNPPSSEKTPKARPKKSWHWWRWCPRWHCFPRCSCSCRCSSCSSPC